MRKIKLELTFPGKFKDEPIICELCKKFNIILKIMEASFSTDTGWAIITLEGDEKELTKSLDYIKEKGIEIREN